MTSLGQLTVPFFESSPVAAGPRLLLVTYSFPPDTDVGAIRWEMMLRHAARLGWSADVLMMDPAASVAPDRSRLDTLPSGVRLFGIKRPESVVAPLVQLKRRWLPDFPHRSENTNASIRHTTATRPKDSASPTFDVVQAIKRNFLARDYFATWQRWARRAAATGIELARERRYECIISSGPPHMAHEAARQIAVAISRPLITDLRDPWTSEDLVPSDMSGRSWTALSRHFERECLKASAVIVANTKSAARFIRAQHPDLAERVIVIMNGADSQPCSPVAHALPFTISYTGTIYGGRSPESLFRGVRRLVDSHGLALADLVLRFMGAEQSQCNALVALARKEGIADLFSCEPRRPRPESIALLERSAMLVVLPQIHIHSVPAKIFEYVQHSAWLLVLSEPGTATAELLQNSAADIVSPGDVDGIAHAIGRRFDESRRGVKPVPVNFDGRFARERQAELFFAAVGRLV